MTPEEINKAIAEACGFTWSVPHYSHEARWEVTLHPDGANYWRKEDSEWAGNPPVFEGCYQNLSAVPNYYGCLNACHQMEQTIRVGKDRNNPVLRRYRDQLAKVINCGWYQSAQLICASAPQRCEAFLRLKGLWPDDSDAASPQ